MSLPNFHLRKPEDDIEKKVIVDVQEFGWHVVHILEDEIGPQYSFTVGLFYSFQHPELLMMGLDRSLTHQIFTNVVEEISKGGICKANTCTDRLLESFNCKFISIKKESYSEYLGCAEWFYRGLQESYPVLQILWPDKNGKFPDEEGFESRFNRLQIRI